MSADVHERSADAITARSLGGDIAARLRAVGSISTRVLTSAGVVLPLELSPTPVEGARLRVG
jgi:hypothetical protein